MNDAAYRAWIEGLPDATRDLVQTLLALIGAQIDDRFNALAADIGRVERRQKTNSERVAELNLRLDQYEERTWSAAKEAIEQFAATQLPTAERDALIQVLYNLARDVEALKGRQVNGDEHG